MKKILFCIALLAMILCFQFAPAQVSNTATYTVIVDTAVVTRPLDSSTATAYAAGDLIGSANVSNWFVFSTIGTAYGNKNGGNGYIVEAELSHDTCNATAGTFTLELYSDSCAASIADNAAITHLWGDRKNFLDTLGFTLGISGASSTMARCVVKPTKCYYQAGTSSKKIFGRLMATGAYTPKNAGTFRIRLVAERLN